MRSELHCLALVFSESRWRTLLAVVALATLADTLLVATGGIRPLNESLTRAVYQIRQPWLDLPMTALTYLGGVLLMSLVTLAAAAWASRQGYRRDGVLLIASAVAALVTQLIVKAAVGAPRPDPPSPPYPLDPILGNGYPSGHALASTVVLGFIALMVWDRTDRTPVRVGILVLNLALIAGIGLSRVYLGVHWVNDVVGGYLYGALILLIAYRLHRCDPLEHRPGT